MRVPPSTRCQYVPSSSCLTRLMAAQAFASRSRVKVLFRAHGYIKPDLRLLVISQRFFQIRFAAGAALVHVA